MSQAEASTDEGAPNETNDADKLSQDADRAERLIRSLIVGDHVDTELAKDLHNDLVTMFGHMVEEHEEITAGEIALVMWAEVLRIEDLVTEAEKEVEEADSSTRASMEEALDNEDMELIDQPAEDEGQDAASPPNDPAFH